MSNDIRAANHGADHSPNNRAWRSGDHGAGARSDGNAFQRSSLGHHRNGRQRQHDDRNLELGTHEIILVLKAVLRTLGGGRLIAFVANERGTWVRPFPLMSKRGLRMEVPLIASGGSNMRDIQGMWILKSFLKFGNV
jgi:hypothetical protein